MEQVSNMADEHEDQREREKLVLKQETQRRTDQIDDKLPILFNSPIVSSLEEGLPSVTKVIKIISTHFLSFSTHVSIPFA